ncbi:unnamed protein product [Allacma fusca]|uniref:Uncharacterized protein n=1 Tax=Allacma fusca TaxID=39272 RepID=A0A8J2K4X7_9HEXA|nr:unnamed protein product [Allacma fusca]
MINSGSTWGEVYSPFYDLLRNGRNGRVFIFPPCCVVNTCLTSNHQPNHYHHQKADALSVFNEMTSLKSDAFYTQPQHKHQS